jgi:hypothetical protein
MIRPVNSAKRPFLRWKTSAACNAGQIAVASGGLALPAAAGLVTAATVLGVFVEDAASGALAYIYAPDQEFEADIYQASTIDTAALANQGVLYDIYVDGSAGDGSAEGEMYLNLNDTTGGFLALSQYDNTRRVATFNFLKTSLYL